MESIKSLNTKNKTINTQTKTETINTLFKPYLDRIDIFSVGKTIEYMLPYFKENEQQVKMKMFVSKIIDPNPEDRWTAEQALSTLQQLKNNAQPKGGRKQRISVGKTGKKLIK